MTDRVDDPRVLRIRAEDAARFARVLRSETADLAGGHLALWGHGAYANRAIAVGIDQSVTADAFERLEVRSAAVVAGDRERSLVIARGRAR